jgi:hypothetical protein
MKASCLLFAMRPNRANSTVTSTLMNWAMLYNAGSPWFVTFHPLTSDQKKNKFTMSPLMWNGILTSDTQKYCYRLKCIRAMSDHIQRSLVVIRLINPFTVSVLFSSSQHVQYTYYNWRQRHAGLQTPHPCSRSLVSMSCDLYVDDCGQNGCDFSSKIYNREMATNVGENFLWAVQHHTHTHTNT